MGIRLSTWSITDFFHRASVTGTVNTGTTPGAPDIAGLDIGLFLGFVAAGMFVVVVIISLIPDAKRRISARATVVTELHEEEPLSILEDIPEVDMWACPRCGAKLKPEEVITLKSGSPVSCDYCENTLTRDVFRREPTDY